MPAYFSYLFSEVLKVKPNPLAQQNFEKLLDFAHFTARTLELYDSIRSNTTRELLLAELHQRYRHLNGCVDMKRFQVHLLLLTRLLNEIPSHPEHVEAGIECAEQLIESVERTLLAQLDKNAA
ncbi:MAG: hypothetical protein HY587_06370 [Candidatus Omnitrophica bacterium]|nr:hypothetical protein [Candidatus Omnitrophota bacterium]